MKKILVKISKWLLPIFGASSAVSCMMAAEYGCPYMKYQIQGKVTDEQGNPITNIAVTTPEHHIDTIWTDKNGVFYDEGKSFPLQDMNKITLQFTDVDDESNGGKFARQEKNFPLIQIEKGDKKWYEGSYKTEDLKIILKKEQISEK